jgi:hypothetical protein
MEAGGKVRHLAQSLPPRRSANLCFGALLRVRKLAYMFAPHEFGYMHGPDAMEALVISH